MDFSIRASPGLPKKGMVAYGRIDTKRTVSRRPSDGGPYRKIQVLRSGGVFPGSAGPDDGGLQRPAPLGPPPGRRGAPRHGVPVRRAGRAVRRLHRTGGPHPGRGPVRGLPGQLSGRRLHPGRLGHPREGRRPAGGAPAPSLHGAGGIPLRLYRP